MKNPTPAQKLRKTGFVRALDESAWGDSARRYFEYVDFAMREKWDEEFSNDSVQQALYIILKFFRRADREVRIFSGSLEQSRTMLWEGEERNVPVYADENLLGAVRAFLAYEDTSLRIVLENEPDADGGIESHPLVKKVQELKHDEGLDGSCEIVGLAKDCADKLRKDGLLQHMTIMDQSAYRLETDHGRAEAVVNANGLVKAKELIDRFDNVLWANSKPLWSSSDTANCAAG